MNRSFGGERMRSFRLILVLAIFAVFAACATPQPTTEDLTPVYNRLDDLDDRVSSLEKQIGDLSDVARKSDLENLSSRIDAVARRAEDAARRAENAARKSEKAFELRTVK
jgi:hypothetical protein